MPYFIEFKQQASLDAYVDMGIRTIFKHPWGMQYETAAKENANATE